MKKRIISIIVVLSIIASVIICYPITANALSNSEIHSRLAEILYQSSGGYVSCGFDGYTTTKGRHEGIDFCRYNGAAVHSLINGTVIRVNNTSSSLSTLAIYDEENDKSVIYLHTANICVSNGSSVRQGQLVAYESNRGASAAHTHVEVRNGWQQYAAYSVNDYNLENPNPYPYWEKILGGPVPPPVTFEVDNRYPTPISAYPAATSGKVSVFNANLAEYSQSTRYIAWNDLCTINAVYTNGYCNVTYPSGNSTHTEYARTSDFIPNGVSPYGWRPDSKMNTYVRSDMSNVFGSISSVDNCTVVGKSGNKIQLIYPLDSGGYKLGWVDATVIPPSDFPTPMIGYNASPTERTNVHASLDSMGDDYGQIFVDDRCTLTSVSVSGGWIYVTYPINGGTKSGYVYLNDFVPDSSRLTHFVETTVTQQSDAFRKSDMAVSIGWVSANDPITVVGKSGNKLQVLYPVDEQYGGGYKIAWIYDTYIKKNLTGISISSNPSKIEYLEGENLNTNGLTVTAHYDDGSTANVTGSCSFSGYNSTPGVKTITVSYNGKQTAFTVRVNSKSPVSLSVTKLPTKTIYNLNEAVSLSGIEAEVAYNNNTKEKVNTFDPQWDDTITNSSGTKSITVYYSYNNITVNASFNITVKEAETTQPDTQPTEPTQPDNPPVNPDDAAFKVSNVLCKSGDTISVDVSIVNNPAITSLKINLDYPTNILTLTSVEYKDLFSTRATGTNRFESPFTISWFSTGSVNENDNGVLATLTFTVAQDATEGIYPITLTYDPDDIFDSNFDNKEFAVVNGEIIVSNSIPGDVNSDRKVNMKDIVLLQQYLNGWSVELDMIAANVNGDAKVNMKDIVLLQQYLNGWEVTLN